MLDNFIRNFFVYSSALFTFYKLLNIKPSTKITQLMLLFSSVITSIFSAVIFDFSQSFNWIFILLIFFLTMRLFSKVTFSLTYTTVLFAFALSFITFSMSILITSVLLSPFFYMNYELPWFLIRILMGILHCLIIYCCFQIPRFKKGMRFLYNIRSNNIGSTICLFLFMIILLLCQPQTTLEAFSLKILAGTFIFSLLLLYWWNYHITQTYRRFLRKNELDSLYLLLEKRNHEILVLKDENDYLAGLIHKDNKIIPAITRAILESHEKHVPLDLSQWETDSPLFQNLKELYDERMEALKTHEEKALTIPHTCFDTVNAYLSHMKAETHKAGIPFHIVLFDKLESTIPAEITEKDFTHMLSDLLANAFHACLDVPDASIQVYLGTTEGISTIRICNTGNVFHMETLNNLGLSKHTTHAHTGGSGIGLMSIWNLKQKYAATLLIDESIDIDTASTCTCMNILFNHKNHYIIQSNRHKELNAYIDRPDVMIISKN